MARVRKNDTKRTNAEARVGRSAIDAVERVRLWHNAGEAYATIDADTRTGPAGPRPGTSGEDAIAALIDEAVPAQHEEHVALPSAEFARWVIYQYIRAGVAPPGADARAEMMAVLAAKAVHGREEYDLSYRLAGHDGNVYYDIGDAARRCVEITPAGWHIVDRAPTAIKFIRSRTMLAAPLPQVDDGFTLDALRDLFNPSGDDDWALLLAYLIGGLNPDPPYPILFVAGEHGSGKSAVTSMIRALLDPSRIPMGALPHDERDFILSLLRTRCGFFDNTGEIPGWLSDTMARTASGSGFQTRRLYTDDGLIVFFGARLLAINSIIDPASRPDLVDRAVQVNLGVLDGAKRRPDAEIRAAFEALRPRAMAALFDGVSAALRNRDTTAAVAQGRNPSFEKWVIGAAPGLGLDPAAFIAAYAGAREASFALAVENDPFASAIVTMMRAHPDPIWEGRASDLLSRLDTEITDAIRKSKHWPATPRGAASHVARATPALRKVGIAVERRRDPRTRDRIIAIRKPPNQHGG